MYTMTLTATAAAFLKLLAVRPAIGLAIGLIELLAGLLVGVRAISNGAEQAHDDDDQER
jgi:hypothetical protein